MYAGRGPLRPTGMRTAHPPLRVTHKQAARQPLRATDKQERGSGGGEEADMEEVNVGGGGVVERPQKRERGEEVQL
ncbi:hypothetical protein FACS189472_18390 [Alphaproteobacteria bacterium]|nr:hypothetical protein FACS189472_18390 [Alphaproteobacteria bacterium]